MRTSSDRIMTSHVGSLPRPDDLIAANRAREAGEVTDEQDFQETLRTAVAEVVRRQQELGIAIPNDGEFGKSMGQRVNYGAWLSYSFHRLGGLTGRLLAATRELVETVVLVTLGVLAQLRT